jgi:hypothetical protein
VNVKRIKGEPKNNCVNVPETELCGAFRTANPEFAENSPAAESQPEALRRLEKRFHRKGYKVHIAKLTRTSPRSRTHQWRHFLKAMRAKISRS